MDHPITTTRETVSTIEETVTRTTTTLYTIDGLTHDAIRILQMALQRFDTWSDSLTESLTHAEKVETSALCCDLHSILCDLRWKDAPRVPDGRDEDTDTDTTRTETRRRFTKDRSEPGSYGPVLCEIDGDA